MKKAKRKFSGLNSVVFYYLFLVVPFYWWAALGVGFLFWAEPPFKKWKIAIGGLGYFLLLGCYPPNIALVLCVFVGKKIFDYVFRNKEFREIFYSFLMFGLQLIVGGILFKILLTVVGFDNERMYNVRTLAIGDVLRNIPKELVYSVVNLFKLKGELGYSGVAFLVGVIGGGCFCVIKKAKNKFVVVGMVLALLMCSRFMFLVSREGQLAFFRGGYWGVLGLVVWGMCAFGFEKNNLVKNLFFAFSVVFLMVFIIRDFEIQKTRKLMFDAEIKFKERVKTRVVSDKAFSYNNDYVSLILGSYDFFEHFCFDGCKGYSNEILASVSMGGDFIPLLFFDDEKYPVTIKLGAWDRLIWHINDGRFVKYRGVLQGINKEDVNNIKSFMYYNEKEWPSKESVFVDDKHIFVMFRGGRENIYLVAPKLLDFLGN